MDGILMEPVLFSDISLIFFFIVAVFMVFTALGTIFSRDPLHSVIFLVGNLLGVAALYASLGASFLSTVQIAVYAGAIMVLFMFLVMLLNSKIEVINETSLLFKFASMGAGIVFVCVMIYVYLGDVMVGTRRVGSKLAPLDEGAVIGDVLGFGRVLFREHLFLFEAVSAVLMVAMVSAVMLAAKTKKIRSKSVTLIGESEIRR
jgi:NADH-quinone oxidoreductase subunit J